MQDFAAQYVHSMNITNCFAHEKVHSKTYQTVLLKQISIYNVRLPNLFIYKYVKYVFPNSTCSSIIVNHT